MLRGGLVETSRHLWAETNLLVLASAPWVTPLPAAARQGRPPRVALLPAGNGDGAQARAAAVAARLGQVLGAGAGGAARFGPMAAPDLLVLARREPDPALLRRGPLLLVG